MDSSRRKFVGMGAAAVAIAAAAKPALAKARTATTDPLKAPKDRFWIAALTPMDRSGAFDNGANDALLAWWKEQGADGVLLLGTTGQGQAFSVAERKRVIEQAGRNKHGLDFIVGTGAANIADTIELSRHAADNGADSVLIVPPYYDKNPKMPGLVAYFDQVFAQVKTPVRYYHIPKTTGVPVDVDFLKALTKYPNFVGVKDSNGDAAEFDAISAALPGLNVVTGTDNLLPNALGHGCGCILASGNVFTRQVAAVFQARRAGQDTAAAIQHLSETTKAFRAVATGAEGGYGNSEAGSKYALSLMAGTHELYVRAPSLPLVEGQRLLIQQAVAQLKAKP